MIRVAFALCLLLSGCRLRPATEPASLPPLPTTVPSALGPVTVTLVPDLVAEKEKVWGVWWVGRRTIEIEQRAPRAMQWLVLYHELCHVMYDASGLAYLTPAAHQEATCDAFAAARFQERFG